MDSLVAAVTSGADEVYLGVGGYNARNNIEGFTLDNLQEAVDYAHVYGVRVCLTVNILFADEEMQEAVDLVITAHNMGVDAFIVQDLGLASILHTQAPEVVLHASTQMGLHNLEGVRAVLPYGFRRVVLARETPLDEVKRIRENTDVEIEYFVQGALCVCFSGNCYLSERLCDASGNRGKCKQLCRLPYTLSRNGVALKKGYLLSAKDFNMMDRLDDLAAAGVDVLKIEGRARRPSYVAMTTAEYRKALDGKRPDKERLALSFNRLYTAGYFDGNGDVISPYNNHIGIAVGKVKEVVKGKRFDEVHFTADRPIAPRSALKFFVQGEEESTVSAYDLKEERGGYVLTTTQKVSVGAEVRLIQDARLEAEVLSVSRRVAVPMALRVAVGEPLMARFEIEGQTYTFEGIAPQAALNQPLTEDDFRANLDKSPYFEAVVTFDELEDVFLPKKQLNEWRRELFAYIYDIRTSPYRRSLGRVVVGEAPLREAVADYAVVREVGELPQVDVAVYSPAVYRMEDVAAFTAKCRETGVRPYLDLPNYATDEDIAVLKRIVDTTGVGVVANNYYALHISDDVLLGEALNVYNGYTAAALARPVVANGVPYMTLRHCPMQAHVGGDCAHCAYADGYVYTLESGKELHLTRKKVVTCTFYLC